MKQLEHQSECIENPIGEVLYSCPGLLSRASTDEDRLREAALSSGADQQCISSALFLGVEREESKGGFGGTPRMRQGRVSSAVSFTDLA